MKLQGAKVANLRDRTYQRVVNNAPPLKEVTVLSPGFELSEISGDTIVALFQILEFPWGDSIGALFKNSRSILHIFTLQIRFKIAKNRAPAARFTLLK